MKKILPLLATLALIVVPSVTRADDTPVTKPAETTPATPAKFKWFTSIESARKAARAANKPILMLFTGSDWCPWCIKLEKEILSQKDFKTWATGHVVLYIADYTHHKPVVDKAGNDKLMKEYGVGGFPTIVITTAAGKKIGSSGYKKMTPAEYAKDLEGIIGKGA